MIILFGGRNETICPRSGGAAARQVGVVVYNNRRGKFTSYGLLLCPLMYA